VWDVLPTDDVLARTGSVDAMDNLQYVSGDHCQEGTGKAVWELVPREGTSAGVEPWAPPPPLTVSLDATATLATLVVAMRGQKLVASTITRGADLRYRDTTRRSGVRVYMAYLVDGDGEEAAEICRILADGTGTYTLRVGASRIQRVPLVVFQSLWAWIRTGVPKSVRATPIAVETDTAARRRDGPPPLRWSMQTQWYETEVTMAFRYVDTGDHGKPAIVDVGLFKALEGEGHDEISDHAEWAADRVLLTSTQEAVTKSQSGYTVTVWATTASQARALRAAAAMDIFG
jgi:hypothetical protein